MKNLLKNYDWYNPFCAITNKNKSYELDNIIIYSEFGILIETNKGWFDHGNNEIESLEIYPEIKYKTKINLNSKDNFIVKSIQKDYKLDRKYTLYLYYKNVNYKYIGLSLDNLFLNLNYSILNNYNNYIVIGDRDKQSKNILYSKDFEETKKNINNYSLQYEPTKFIESLKKLENLSKKYIKALEYERKLTISNYKELIRKNSIKFLENNKKI